jgi:hypothetical protein
MISKSQRSRILHTDACESRLEAIHCSHYEYLKVLIKNIEKYILVRNTYMPTFVNEIHGKSRTIFLKHRSSIDGNSMVPGILPGAVHGAATQDGAM